MVKTYLIYLKIPAGSTIWSGPGTAKTHYNIPNESLASHRKEALCNFIIAKTGETPAWINNKAAFLVEMDESLVDEINSLPVVKKIEEQ